MAEPVVNIHKVDGFFREPENSTRFGATIAMVGRRLGLAGIGCSYIAVEPGRRAFPAHNHLGNDELFVILEGEGTYRFGDAEYPVGPGRLLRRSQGRTGQSPPAYKYRSDDLEIPGDFDAPGPRCNRISGQRKIRGRRDSARRGFHERALEIRGTRGKRRRLLRRREYLTANPMRVARMD